jgi:hypothetical protein
MVRHLISEAAAGGARLLMVRVGERAAMLLCPLSARQCTEACAAWAVGRDGVVTCAALPRTFDGASVLGVLDAPGGA